MPRSRSMSMRSRYWSRFSRSDTSPVISRMRSASVDLPWSIWAMMLKLRICSCTGIEACPFSRMGSASGGKGLPPLGPAWGNDSPQTPRLWKRERLRLYVGCVVFLKNGINGVAVYSVGNGTSLCRFRLRRGRGRLSPRRSLRRSLSGCRAAPCAYFFPKPGMANLRSSFWRNHVAKETRTR